MFTLFFSLSQSKNLFFFVSKWQIFILEYHIVLILLLKQTCIDLDAYNDADYVNFDMAEGVK